MGERKKAKDEKKGNEEREENEWNKWTMVSPSTSQSHTPISLSLLPTSKIFSPFNDGSFDCSIPRHSSGMVHRSCGHCSRFHMGGSLQMRRSDSHF